MPTAPVTLHPTCLVVIDGWGISSTDPKSFPGDAIRHAKTPCMSALMQGHSPVPHRRAIHTTLAAHGLSVGLPGDLMGNSEVGHLNIGAGRVVYQDITRIDVAMEQNTMRHQPALAEAIQRTKNTSGARLHLLGLVSDGGVHSHIQHLFHLLDVAREEGVKECFVHFFGDGRDTAPKSAIQYVQQLQDHFKKHQYGRLATVIGRYYAMDRDKRWERIKVAYDALVSAQGQLLQENESVVSAMEASYARNETDEFFKPMIIDSKGTIQENDTLIFFNYRSDRMREIVQTFGIPPLPFESVSVPKNLHIICMTRYKEEFPFPVISPPQSLDNVLSEWLSKHQIPQVHIAETEKYAHVTFFFNGGSETEYSGEDRRMIPSPKVATYDLQPEMSAKGVAESVVEAIASKKYSFVLCNFAPPDMVGHTGQFEPAVKAVEATDAGIAMIAEACRQHGYALAVTADHGNAEKMVDEVTGQPHTAHTTARVPFVIESDAMQWQFKSEEKKHALCDVAPTLLTLMGLPVPKEMLGESLII